MRISHFANENARSELLGLLKKFSYQKKEVILASGQSSDFYIDCKQVSFRADGAALLGRLFFEVQQMIASQYNVAFAACGGMAMGSIPLASALSLHALAHGTVLHSVCVRKNPKDHGAKNAIEGSTHLPKKTRILMVEDVITTAGSTINAAIELRNAGFDAEHVLAIVDREAGGEDNLARQGLKLHTLFNLSDF